MFEHADRLATLRTLAARGHCIDAVTGEPVRMLPTERPEKPVAPAVTFDCVATALAVLWLRTGGHV